MTDDVQVAPTESQEPVATTPVAETPVQQASETPVQQKMLPQGVVDKIVGTRVKEAYAKARAETLAEIEHQRQQADTTQSSMGGMMQASPDQVRQLIQQEAYRMSNEAMANTIANNFTAKMKAGEEKYTDFSEKVEALNLSNHPQLVMWTEKMDNAADVIYDMASNPTKVAHILMLAGNGMHDLAQKELQKLSSSIKANEEAKKVPNVNEPLGQLKPSNIGTGDGSKSTVTDLRTQSWLYG